MASASLIGKTTAVLPSTLHTFHQNPRKGDIGAIASSLRRHTQYKPITVNVGTHTGRPNEVLAGNHTLLAFRQLGEDHPDEKQWLKILVFWIDVDNDTAERIVVADNQTGQLGGFDEEQLARLVQGFEGDIEGLGFGEADVADLMALLEETPPLTDDDDDTPVSNDLSKPGQREDGLINQKDLTQRRDEYAESAGQRMVVLTMPIARFIWVQQKLELVRNEYGAATNTDAVVALLEQWSDETAPSGDDAALIADTDALDAPGDPEGFEE